MPPSGYKKCTSLTDSIRTLCVHCTCIWQTCTWWRIAGAFFIASNHSQCFLFSRCIVNYTLLYFATLQRVPSAVVVIADSAMLMLLISHAAFALVNYDCLRFILTRIYLCEYVCVCVWRGYFSLLFPCNLVSEWIVANTRKNLFTHI